VNERNGLPRLRAYGFFNLAGRDRHLAKFASIRPASGKRSVAGTAFAHDELLRSAFGKACFCQQ
jgi:hypothetical protein